MKPIENRSASAPASPALVALSMFAPVIQIYSPSDALNAKPPVKWDMHLLQKCGYRNEDTTKSSIANKLGVEILVNMKQVAFDTSSIEQSEQIVAALRAYQSFVMDDIEQLVSNKDGSPGTGTSTLDTLNFAFKTIDKDTKLGLVEALRRGTTARKLDMRWAKISSLEVAQEISEAIREVHTLESVDLSGLSIMEPFKEKERKEATSRALAHLLESVASLPTLSEVLTRWCTIDTRVTASFVNLLRSSATLQRVNTCFSPIEQESFLAIKAALQENMEKYSQLCMQLSPTKDDISSMSSPVKLEYYH